MGKIERDFKIEVQAGFQKTEILKALRYFSHAYFKILMIDENDEKIRVLVRLNEEDEEEVAKIIC
ncbi:MAG: hypothetical protein COZ34_02805 [Candidatus Pacebacteria bacterium CG_4_10_14_3_um_filter_34_15]|nr:hypothetical protein [Candidatus Pacearchaeota archaeon]NCQ65315.1 hypothetical protein [Candidatus Paceibacterota bacterium]OIO44343.1 MAG: hypothetical protein AUJ41_03045 [Candidatus Pacebacteria bacterium CG1_02_43_31]PIQ80893.1 MAG: hypothetical protein COV78_03060 [Candidatus Pacebacteria bacterium CG11_big_fil_rev_8_21_14_0_20_34_55]PIX81507.1 MAG: hypothetical protein COZ34_02805 [Candidatus Pacebacteria bacterium CG_4_10_14_3_um_filter_34_15]PJC43776.1 MAG: hypothetical protein CO0